MTDAARPCFLWAAAFSLSCIRLLALLVGLWLDRARARTVPRQRIAMGFKVWKGRGCCCACVSASLWKGGRGLKKCLSLCSVESGPVLLLPPVSSTACLGLPPHSPVPFLSQREIRLSGRCMLSQGSLLGWEDCVL